ncbi:YtxH domain-containing protein [Filobacillus milosensis]|uniref:YtxH domain-containing protein n=1 Tax=Filobacillus milosensis TaxID=94137 RepID=A0A4Y8IP50_9BACI|nr:YtxH domain-containing protein [Filobacillus milosensis]TFB22088.1 YtxH domain-containing protein [Filobacillus milosensis]
MASGKSLMLGVFFGSVVGASVSLLTTPNSGEELRTKVKDQSDRLRDIAQQIREDGLDLKNQLSKTSKEGAALLRDLSEDIKVSVESWKETIEPHQENLQEHLRQIEESIKELEDKVKENPKQEV